MVCRKRASCDRNLGQLPGGWCRLQRQRRRSRPPASSVRRPLGRPKKLGKASISIAAGKTQTIKVKLTKKGSNAVLSAGQAEGEDLGQPERAGSGAGTASRKAKLKAP